MDRVNRSFLVASTLLAIPLALTMASLTTGTTPESEPTIELAVGEPGGNEAGSVQQVIGKQPSSPKTRPGLFQVISGAKPSGSRNHQHENMGSNSSKGLLDGLFERSNAKRSTSRSRSSNRSSQASKSNSEWDGIPYHRGGGSTRTSESSLPEPIRDPSRVASKSGRALSSGQTASSSRSSSNSGSTRIIRGGSSRSIQAAPASSRRSSGPTLARQPAQPISVPTNAAPIRSTRESASSSSGSSRRSNRKSVGALDPSEIAAASRNRVPTEQEEVSDLVPRVIEEDVVEETKPTPAKTARRSKPARASLTDRKVANSDEPTKAAPAKGPAAATKPAEKVAQSRPSQTPAANVATKSAPTTVPSAEVSTIKKPATPTGSVAGNQQGNPEANTALAAIGMPTPSPAPSQQPPSGGEATQGQVSPSPTGRPGYTTPVDPAKSPVPVAGIPSHPYAASMPAPANPRTSIPAAPASHRAGPPNAAFGAGQIAQAPPSAPGYAPQPYQGGRAYGQPNYPQPQFNSASTPIGSGVAPKSASYRRPAQGGVYQPIPTPSYPNDPYAPQTFGATPPAMTTTGQPVRSQPEASTTARPPQRVATLPSQPTVPYDRTRSTPTEDNFARSTFDSRNQMRDSTAGLPPGATAVSSELPGIRVVTYGPESIMIRQTSQYEIRVENRGSIDASGVLVRAAIPDWADVRGQNASRGEIEKQKQGKTERLVWTIDSLPAGASERMYVRLMAARSGTYDLDVDWTLQPQKSIAKVQVKEPRLDLTIEGPDEVVYGQSQTYKVRVLNPGDGTAPNVVFTLSPNSATPQTQRIGDIPPGKEAQFDVELTAQDLGDLKIHGLAAGDLELRAESAKTIRVAAAKLEAMLTGPELKYQNTEGMYSLQVQNTGTATSEKIIATLRLPSGVKYLGGIDEAALQGAALKWEITALAPGATRNYQFRCTMSSTGEHLFAFDCQGTAAGNTDVSLATRVESIADLVLSVSDPAAPAPIGSDVTYEIVIRNRGSKEATDVRAVAQFSHGIEPQRIEGQSGEVVTGQVLFDPIPRIAAGQEVRMRVVAQADRAGHHRFRTEVRSGDTVLVAEEATHYMSPKSDRVSRRSSDSRKR